MTLNAWNFKSHNIYSNGMTKGVTLKFYLCTQSVKGLNIQLERFWTLWERDLKTIVLSAGILTPSALPVCEWPSWADFGKIQTWGCDAKWEKSKNLPSEFWAVLIRIDCEEAEEEDECAEGPGGAVAMRHLRWDRVYNISRKIVLPTTWKHFKTTSFQNRTAGIFSG